MKFLLYILLIYIGLKIFKFIRFLIKNIKPKDIGIIDFDNNNASLS